MVMMVTSPTFRAARRLENRRGLCALALVNVGFVTACGALRAVRVQVPPGMREDFLNSLENVRDDSPSSPSRSRRRRSPRGRRCSSSAQRATAVRAEASRPRYDLRAEWEGVHRERKNRARATYHGEDHGEDERMGGRRASGRSASSVHARGVRGRKGATSLRRRAARSCAARAEALGAAGTDGFTPELSASAKEDSAARHRSA